VLLIGSLCGSFTVVYAQAQGSASGPPERPPLTEGFHFNKFHTTPFGPAYADIWVKQQNFLSCKPPLGRSFSYALCFFSGPAVGTPVPSDGSASVNPALPCTLASDGKTASCTCYAISTNEYPPYIPYFVDINSILNLDLYLGTVSICGHSGSGCGPREPIGADSFWNEAPVCGAVNRNEVIPGAQLISVFSAVKNDNYTSSSGSNSTSCAAGKYAGCMTAPCHHTGRHDAAGEELVECTCPVYDGPFEIGQGGVPCDANALTPPPADGASAPIYVWSAAHSPIVNHPPIDPPATGCLPDAPDGKGCPLYSPTKHYPVSKDSPVCRKVCETYRTGIRQSTNASLAAGIQVDYSCDAALCTTVRIGQTGTPPSNPLGKANVLRNACSSLAQQSGVGLILALEQLAQCSCCASQVCGCAEPGADINAATENEIATLNSEQQVIGITPQCEINGTLCGAQSAPE